VANEYVIYCDESDKHGLYYSNFYGGALIHAKDLDIVNHTLEQRKKALNLLREIKWARVTEHYLDKYKQIMDAYFDLIKKNKIKIRIMFTQNIFTADNLSNYHREHEYFLLYYQFIKHAFGLQYAADGKEKTRIRIYLDELPETKEKSKLFKSYLHSLSNYAPFRHAGIVIPQDQIADVNSSQHVILQCLDIILGAIHFRLNDKHKIKLPNSNKRGKRTVAKECLYKHINQYIREMYPNFNIGCTTSVANSPENKWNHRYRHWLFKPKDRKTDLSKAKSNNKKVNPAFATA